MQVVLELLGYSCVSSRLPGYVTLSCPHVESSHEGTCCRKPQRQLLLHMPPNFPLFASCTFWTFTLVPARCLTNMLEGHMAEVRAAVQTAPCSLTLLADHLPFAQVGCSSNALNRYRFQQARSKLTPRLRHIRFSI